MRYLLSVVIVVMTLLTPGFTLPSSAQASRERNGRKVPGQRNLRRDRHFRRLVQPVGNVPGHIFGHSS